MKWAKEFFLKNVQPCVRVVLVMDINIVLVYKKLGTIIFNNFRFFLNKIFFFCNFDLVINSKLKRRPLSFMAQNNYFLI